MDPFLAHNQLAQAYSKAYVMGARRAAKANPAWVVDMASYLLAPTSHPARGAKAITLLSDLKKRRTLVIRMVRNCRGLCRLGDTDCHELAGGYEDD
jgi:hypothetical protein